MSVPLSILLALALIAALWLAVSLLWGARVADGANEASGGPVGSPDAAGMAGVPAGRKKEKTDGR